MQHHLGMLKDWKEHLNRNFPGKIQIFVKIVKFI